LKSATNTERKSGKRNENANMTRTSWVGVGLVWAGRREPPGAVMSEMGQ